jgi:hypothetical protein
VVTWVHLYQWGDVIDVKGDGRAKRLGTPALDAYKLFGKGIILGLFIF